MFVILPWCGVGAASTHQILPLRVYPESQRKDHPLGLAGYHCEILYNCCLSPALSFAFSSGPTPFCSWRC